MSTHIFNIKVAEAYGIGEAIILQNISFWQSKNEANDTNFHDGKYWVYNSVKAFEKLFPYWSKGQINRILKSLEEKEVLFVGNYNKISYDRTKWYSLERELHLLISGNGVTEIEKPIPDINTDSKPDNKNIEKDFDIFWSDYPRKIGKGKARSSYESARKKASHDEIMRGVFISPRLKGDDPQYLPHASTWLNQESWTDEEEVDPKVFPWPNLVLVRDKGLPGGELYVDKDKGICYDTRGNKSDIYDWDKNLNCVTA